MRLPIEIQRAGEFRIDDETGIVTVGFVTKAGDVVDLAMDGPALAATLSTMIEARAIASTKGLDVKAKSMLVKDFKNWEVGMTQQDAMPVLLFDKGLETQNVYRFQPRVGREIGRALLHQTRMAEAARAKQTRQ